MSLHSGLLSQASFNINVICLYILSMNYMEQTWLFYFMLMTVSIGVYLNLLEKNCGHSRKEILCEIPGICTLVHVNKDLPDKGSFLFSRLG